MNETQINPTNYDPFSFWKRKTLEDQIEEINVIISTLEKIQKKYMLKTASHIARYKAMKEKRTILLRKLQ